jgi:hypothetical protein
MASRRFTNRLNRVDLPTFGRPTMATILLIFIKFGAKVGKKLLKTEVVEQQNGNLFCKVFFI